MKIQKPKPTGEYAVGTFTYTVKDDREEALLEGTMRSVAARVYYPVSKDAVAGLTKAKYMSRNMTKGLRSVFKIPINYDKLEQKGENFSECYPDAGRISGKRFPLIMFSHGMGSYREGNSYMCIELASHGYVVISVDHARESLCSEYDDGTFLFFDKSITGRLFSPLWKASFEILKLVKEKGSDEYLAGKFEEFQNKYCRFQFGRLDEWVKDTDAALRYAKENLADLIDFGCGIGVSGHSFGGNTAYKLCCTNDEYVCGVNIDGALFGDHKDSVLDKPFMQVSCKENENIVSRVYIRHKKPVYKVLFKDMAHKGFSDMKHQLKPGLTVGKLDPDAMHDRLCRCHLEFFDAYLKKIKDVPDLKSDDVITVKEYAPDM